MTLVSLVAGMATFGQMGGSNATPVMPEVASGRVVRIDSFPSKFLPARRVDIWLPEGFSPKKRYSVLYMHDGQMLFDAKTTWNKQEWEVDETLGRLMKIGAIKDTIVVGLWNRGEFRHAEYYPTKPVEALPEKLRKFILDRDLKGKSLADDYLSFLVKEIKPYIDAHYPTKPDRSNTFVSGSSMGGLISMYALCEYPEVFGGAACLSTHWPGTLSTTDPAIPKSFLTYLDSHLPSPKGHRIYFDRGDQTLDAAYKPWQDQADAILVKHKWGPKSALSLAFPGDNHSEPAWNRRFYLPILFLLGKH